jgi:hypothetical protein
MYVVEIGVRWLNGAYETHGHGVGEGFEWKF